jgi:hypothetical protein
MEVAGRKLLCWLDLDRWALHYASPELRADKKVVLAAVARETGRISGLGVHHVLQYASAELRADKKVVLAAVANGDALQYASVDLRADKEVVLAAVTQHGWPLQYASNKLRADKEFMLKVVAQRGDALMYASEKLRADKKFMLAALALESYTLKYASEQLRADKEVMLMAVALDGNALRYASKKLRADKEVVLTAMAQSGDALEYASNKLRADKEVVLMASHRRENVRTDATTNAATPDVVVVAAPSMIIPTIDLINDDDDRAYPNLRARTTAGNAITTSKPKRRAQPRHGPTKRSKVSKATASRPSRWAPVVKIETENIAEGLIRCPSCSNGITVSERGCSTVTCRSEAHKPSGSFFYFCFHCRTPRPGGVGYCHACPQRNDRQTRQHVLALTKFKVAEQNKISKANPIDLTD